MKKSIKEQFIHTKPGDVGIIGDPVEHSLSPLIQNAAFKTWWASFRDRDESTPAYHRFHVKPEQLEEAIQLMKEHQLRGLNVTVPHKNEACRFMDVLDPFAKRVQAINTISFSSNRLRGFNTDVTGFQRALMWDLDFNPEGATAVVLGAGGTGRVIAMSLVDHLAEKVFLWNRSHDRLDHLLKDPDGAIKKIQVIRKDEELHEIIKGAQLIVNATSVGLDEKDGLPAAGLKFEKHHVAFDVIYHRETPFLAAAKQAGARVAGGLGMLVYQGARSFEIWTGAPAPIELMKSVLSQELQGV